VAREGAGDAQEAQQDQRPMPMFCARWRDLPSVSSDGAIITSAF
jgi:hypothetical protein